MKMPVGCQLNFGPFVLVVVDISQVTPFRENTVEPLHKGHLGDRQK